MSPEELYSVVGRYVLLEVCGCGPEGIVDLGTVLVQITTTSSPSSRTISPKHIILAFRPFLSKIVIFGPSRSCLVHDR